MDETIVALSTPPGRGGVGVVRLSGTLAHSIALTVTQRQEFTLRQATYCHFYDCDNACIDQGIILYFKAPNSFTGEDVIEFQGHGAPIALDRLIQTCLRLGARLARPGEFSERAFLNNKIDLTQAEAIADLIHANSITAARSAVQSLQGEFSKKINQINEQLIHLRLYVEAAIDFPEEEIDFLSDGKIAAMLKQIQDDFDNLLANVTQGVILREGICIVIAGRPNAGKSTLMNALAGQDLAIVTDVAGTTRDVMRAYVSWDDISVHLIDTAGLRESDNLIEQEGIKRAWDEVSRADCVLMLIDINHEQGDIPELNQAIRSRLPENVPIIRVWNKIDTKKDLSHLDNDDVYLSAKLGQGLDLLKTKIKQLIEFHPVEGQFLARRRHLQALTKANQWLNDGAEQLFIHRALELLAEDLRLAHQSLSEITGEFKSDDLLGEIFSSFCIGK